MWRRDWDTQTGGQDTGQGSGHTEAQVTQREAEDMRTFSLFPILPQRDNFWQQSRSCLATPWISQLPLA